MCNFVENLYIFLLYSLNTVREVCVRCPLVMSRELLADLAGYKTYRDKGVVMAARSLIQLYRTVKPELLQRKDRVGSCGCVCQSEFYSALQTAGLNLLFMYPGTTS